MRAWLIIAFVTASISARAETWSFDLPAGYTEVPGAADAQIEQLRKVPGTRSADAQLFVSPDQNVQLTRITWEMKPRGSSISNIGIQGLEKGIVDGGAEGATHISDTQTWNGDQLIAESIDDTDGIRIKQRRLYGRDRAGLLHVVWLICSGPADQLTECEKAQTTMKLTLPSHSPLPQKTDEDKPESLGERIGYAIGYYGVLGLAIGLIILAIRKWG